MNETWMLDVTFWEHNEMPAFVPYEEGTGDVITGLTIIAAKAPGELVGVFHSDGQALCEVWCKRHPDWREIYGPEEKP